MIKKWIVRFIAQVVYNNIVRKGIIAMAIEAHERERKREKEKWEERGYEHTATGWQVKQS